MRKPKTNSKAHSSMNRQQRNRSRPFPTRRLLKHSMWRSQHHQRYLLQQLVQLRRPPSAVRVLDLMLLHPLCHAEFLLTPRARNNPVFGALIRMQGLRLRCLQHQQLRRRQRNRRLGLACCIPLRILPGIAPEVNINRPCTRAVKMNRTQILARPTATQLTSTITSDTDSKIKKDLTERRFSLSTARNTKLSTASVAVAAARCTWSKTGKTSCSR